MSTMSRHCRNRVLRLRGCGGDTPLSSGSRGLAPGILRSLLSLCCSNPRRGFVSPVNWDWQVLPVRLCECEPCQSPPVKSRGHHGSGEVPAKIAAFQGWAPSRIHYIFSSAACWLGARTGTFPPLHFHDPPSTPLTPHPPSGPSPTRRAREKAHSHGPSLLGRNASRPVVLRLLLPLLAGEGAQRADEGPRVQRLTQRNLRRRRHHHPNKKPRPLVEIAA
jgi:hypothetical protein